MLSVAMQTQRPAEVILVDDASGDGTPELMRTLQTRYGDWVRLVMLPANAGAASARNAGWNVATQPFIAFLDADDAWHPQKIEIQYSYMQQHPDVALSGHLCRQLSAGTPEIPAWTVDWAGASQAITWSQLLLKHQFVTPSVMLKRNMRERFFEGARHMEDYRLWLEIAAVPLRMVKLQVELVAVYKSAYGASGLSADMWRMEQAELANYRHFHRVGRLPTAQFLFLQAYSLAKFVRRLIIARMPGRT